MKYHVNFQDLGDFKKLFKDKIDLFRDVVYEVFKTSQEVEWVGHGRDAVISALYNQIEELEKVAKGLDKFYEALEISMSDYSEGAKEVDTKFKEMREIIEEEKIKRGGSSL